MRVCFSISGTVGLNLYQYIDMNIFQWGWNSMYQQINIFHWGWIHIDEYEANWGWVWTNVMSKLYFRHTEVEFEPIYFCILSQNYTLCTLKLSFYQNIQLFYIKTYIFSYQNYMSYVRHTEVELRQLILTMTPTPLELRYQRRQVSKFEILTT